jgi:hypothetical protein
MYPPSIAMYAPHMDPLAMYMQAMHLQAMYQQPQARAAAPPTEPGSPAQSSSSSVPGDYEDQ